MSELTGILLAGGKSRRLGRDKAQEVIGGRRIIDRAIDTLRTISTSQSGVVDRWERIEELNLDSQINYVVDSYDNSGSLGGLYSGLEQSPTRWAILVACDMPFLSARLFEFMVTKISKESQLTIFNESLSRYLQSSQVKCFCKILNRSFRPRIAEPVCTYI